MKLIDYITIKRGEIKTQNQIDAHTETELNKARRTTARMHNYCRKMGLDGKDLDIVWRPPDRYNWRIKRVQPA
jgi:hypothetical protein